MDKFELIIPTIPVDYEMCISNLRWFFEFLPIKGITFIGSDEVGEKVKNTKDNRLHFIEENSIYSLKTVKEIINKNTNGNKEDIRRAGWYYQQFLKLLYSYQCEEEYYLIWDSDTVPVHKVTMFGEDGRPLFDMKTEYHVPYFCTIEKLFGLKKTIDKSFISEHMLFSVPIVKKMIQEIERNTQLKGQDFCEKVLNVVAETGYTQLAFSEFETYGTYVLNRYQEVYGLRDWKSLRRGAWYFEKQQLNKELSNWLSGYYDAISFEKGSVKKKVPAAIMQSKNVRKVISARTFEHLHNMYFAIGRPIMRGVRNLKRILRR